jgi:GTP cyclohydrolase I
MPEKDDLQLRDASRSGSQGGLVMNKTYSLDGLACGAEWMPEDSTSTVDLASGSIDLERIRRAVREILEAVGEDPDREGLKDTPDRVARMYAEVFRGLHQDPRSHLEKRFTQKYDEMLLIKDIRFESFCEHHLLPFIGVAHVAYIPNGSVVGLSKIPRVIEVLSKRPQMQERLTEEVADLLMSELDAKGVAVVVEATHSCMTIRGVHKPGSSFVTSAMRGAFKERLASRSEVMSLIFGGKSRD